MCCPLHATRYFIIAVWHLSSLLLRHIPLLSFSILFSLYLYSISVSSLRIGFRNITCRLYALLFSFSLFISCYWYYILFSISLAWLCMCCLSHLVFLFFYIPINWYFFTVRFYMLHGWRKSTYTLPRTQVLYNLKVQRSYDKSNDKVVLFGTR